MKLDLMAKSAKEASLRMRSLSSEKKSNALLRLADLLCDHKEQLLKANEVDIAAARKAHLSEAMIDRLSLQGDRLEQLAQNVRQIAAMPDPVGAIYDSQVLPSGLHLAKMRVPIGVLAVIYEARPNVTIDVAALALKSGNSVILRGGSETLSSNRALMAVVAEALQQSGLPEAAVQFIDSADRKVVEKLLKLHESIDVVIPRGGATLQRFCREHSQIPVITGGIGICHIFFDESADLEGALKVIQNAKVQRPTVCNALDVLLVHEKSAPVLLPLLAELLLKDGVNFRADSAAYSLLKPHAGAKVQKATQGDFDTEWLSLTLSIKVVPDLESAIAHIQEHSSGHSDAILTRNEEHSRRFVRDIDSAAVYVNASTRFTDGTEFGLGAEIAVSTQKLHARGPMGLPELTTYKWIGWGNNQIRS
jgi:glutamate-5-semialdehyde dehydrogenase